MRADEGAARLRMRVISSIALHPSRTRGQGRRRAALLYASAISIMLALFELAGGLDDAVDRPTYVTGRVVLGAAAIAFVSAWLALGTGGSMTGRGPFVLFATAVAVPTATFVWLTSWRGAYGAPPAGDALDCALLAIAMGSSFLSADFLVRRSAIRERPSAGAASGAAAGAVAGVLAAAWCPVVDAAHVALGHAAPIVILVVIGAALGSRSVDAHQMPGIKR